MLKIKYEQIQCTRIHRSLIRELSKQCLSHATQTYACVTMTTRVDMQVNLTTVQTDKVALVTCNMQHQPSKNQNFRNNSVVLLPAHDGGGLNRQPYFPLS